MEDTTNNEETEEFTKPEFKKPVLVGKVGKLPKKQLNKPATEIKEVTEPKASGSDDKPDNNKHNLPPAVKLKEMLIPIPYKEPKWSGLCPDGSDYTIEVLKSGTIVERIDLSEKPYYIFGRLTNCDVVLAHPTISRHHAVLQYKAFAEESEPPSGWYLYDLGSTHGTFLNKERLKGNHYTRARVGHQIKFGTSSRTYVVNGPDWDCDGESDLTVTEIKQRASEMKIERDKFIQEAKERRERERVDEEKKREEQGIDWGMGEDAEEEPDLSENPYASTANEELYLEDPKKTLRGYMEREGYELQYDCEEKNKGHFLCRVELPIDDARGRPIIAEVTHKGKKKEAVVACALEACRILDRAGLLRQAKHESRRKKARDWSADDYYDSDDDTFLDRTGAVERKRNARMLRNTNEIGEPLTYSNLVRKVLDIDAQIAQEERALQRLREQGRPTGTDEADAGDSLDNFMLSLGKQGHSMAQKAEISNSKMVIKKLQAELLKAQRLADIARPAHMPPIIKAADQSKHSVKIAGNSVVYGKRLRLKDDKDRKPKAKQPKAQNDTEFVEEIDSDEDTSQESTKTIEHLQSSQNDHKNQDLESVNLLSKSNQDNSEFGQNSSEIGQNETETSDKLTETETTHKKQYGPMRPPENYVIPENYFNQTSDRDLPEMLNEEEK